MSHRENEGMGKTKHRAYTAAKLIMTMQRVWKTSTINYWYRSRAPMGCVHARCMLERAERLRSERAARPEVRHRM